MKIIKWFTDKFIVKQIKDKQGVVHFTRWTLLFIPFTTVKLYLHRITAADREEHQHDHPWNFYSLILRGGYTELRGSEERERKPGSFEYIDNTSFHKVLRLHGTTYSLALVFGERRVWGYNTESGWIDFLTYRKNKNDKKTMTLELTEETLFNTINTADKPVLVDIWATWCGPCRMIGPIVDQLAVEYRDRVVVAKLDADKNKNVVAGLGVRSIPTLLIFKGGVVVDKLVGAVSKAAISEKLDQHI